MCIKKLEYKFEENGKVRNAFKVLRKSDIPGDRSYFSPIFTSRPMSLGRKYEANGPDEMIYADERILPRCFPVDMYRVMPEITEEMCKYRSGFHAFARLEDARDYLRHCTDGLHPIDKNDYLVCMVQLQDITGTGWEDNPICRKNGEGTREMEVVVGTNIEILHEVK
jgi:hypothetical protein